MLLLLILASLLDVAGDDGVRTSQCIGTDELFMVESARLGNILEEARVEAISGIPREDQGADMGHLDEELMRPA